MKITNRAIARPRETLQDPISMLMLSSKIGEAHSTQEH